MSRTLFENSKAALAFAAMTIIGAVAMVGTSDDSGVLPAVVERLGTKPAGLAGAGQAGAGQAGSETPAQAGKTATPGAGWGGSTSPFGDYSGKPPVPGQPAGAQAAGAINPMTAPVSPTAIVNPNPPSSSFFSSGSDEPQPPE